jgi:hypothetical protein
MAGETYPGSPENRASTKRHHPEPDRDFTDLGMESSQVLQSRVYSFEVIPLRLGQAIEVSSWYVMNNTFQIGCPLTSPGLHPRRQLPRASSCQGNLPGIPTARKLQF